MRRIALLFMMTALALSAWANRSYKVDCWYDVSRYFSNLNVRYYITQEGDDNIVHFLVESSFAYIQFQLDGLIGDDFIYMAHESNYHVRDQVRFMKDYITYMISKETNFPDNTLYTDKSKDLQSYSSMISFRRNAEWTARWKEGYRQYMVEKGWYKTEEKTSTAAKTQNDENLIDPLADWEPVVETVTAEEAEELYRKSKASEAPKTSDVQVSHTNNPISTDNRSHSVSTAKTNAESHSENKEKNSADNSGAGWLILLAVLYFLFKGNKKNEKSEAAKAKAVDEKRKKEKRERDARRREEEREREEQDRKRFEEMAYYEEWKKQNERGWRG